MPKRLAQGEDTVKLEVKLPSSLKKQAVTMAADHGDGDVAAWLRALIRNEWAKWKQKRGRA